MKKLFTVLFAVLLASVMCVNVLAAPNNFVSSPESDNDTVLEGSDNLTEGCDAVVTLTSFADRQKLDDESRKNLEDARDAIVGSDNLAELCSGLKDKTDKDVSVTDIFDIDYADCDSHGDHDGFTLRIKIGSLDGFVGVINYNGNGWELVDASVNEKGELVITTDKTGAFAVVVESEQDDTSYPNQTGDDFKWWIYAAVMAVCVAALIFIGIKLKKSEK